MSAVHHYWMGPQVNGGRQVCACVRGKYVNIWHYSSILTAINFCSRINGNLATKFAHVTEFLNRVKSIRAKIFPLFSQLPGCWWVSPPNSEYSISSCPSGSSTTPLSLGIRHRPWASQGSSISGSRGTFWNRPSQLDRLESLRMVCCTKPSNWPKPMSTNTLPSVCRQSFPGPVTIHGFPA